jgi:MoxR-like ATPase
MLTQEKLLRIYSFIKDNLYLCSSDMKIGKESFNSNLLFGLLTSINKGKQLVMGEYGGGKTTSSEYLLSMVYGIPRRVMVSSTLKGQPELTHEKVAGRLNLGELNQGNEKVIWSYFVTLEPKIIDEFNRIPESKQNLLLEGADRGNWQYLNDMVSNGDFSMFATINYKDSGNVRIVEAAVDRFEIAVESRFPTVNNIRLIRNRTGGKSSIGGVLENSSIEKKMYDVMLQDKPYPEKRKELRALQEDFKKVVESRTKLELISEAELSSILKEMNKIPFSKDANLFLDLVTAELYSCMMFGQKRSNEGCIENCHYQTLLCGKKTNCDSVRSTFAEKKYAQSLAWLFGDSEVNTSHLSTVMPYVLWHKMKFTDAHVKDYKKDVRDDPLQLYVTKKAVHDMFQRFSKLKDAQSQMYDLMVQDKIAEAKKLASDVDHPVFYEYLKID